MSEQEIKRIDISEFREKGYLQEANRRFFHPLGLALEVVIDDNGTRLGGVWDYRKDPEGIFFGIQDRNEDDKKNMKQKKYFIDAEINKKITARIKLFGGDDGVEPIE